MKKILLSVLALSFFFSIVSSGHAFPEFSEDSMTKIVMPGGIHLFMKKDDALSLLKKRHPVEIYDAVPFTKPQETA